MASGELVDPSGLDKLAADVNGYMLAAAESLDLNAARSAEITSFFAAAARGVAENYLRSRQRAELASMLANHQATIKSVSALGQDVVVILHDAAWQDYGIDVEASLKQISDGAANSMTPAPANTASTRRAAVRELIAVNKEHQTRLQILKGLHDAYARLPNAHAELHDAVVNDDFDLRDIRRLAEEGKHLYDLYEELKQAQPE